MVGVVSQMRVYDSMLPEQTVMCHRLRGAYVISCICLLFVLRTPSLMPLFGIIGIYGTMFCLLWKDIKWRPFAILERTICGALIDVIAAGVAVHFVGGGVCILLPALVAAIVYHGCVYGPQVMLISGMIGSSVFLIAAATLKEWVNTSPLLGGIALSVMMVSILLFVIIYQHAMLSQSGQNDQQSKNVFDDIKKELLSTSKIIQAKDKVIADKELDRQRVEKLNLSLENQVSTDPLTGLANRRCFDKTMVERWREAASLEQNLVLITLDIDHFKNFNDTYGHQVGDECLKTVSETLSREVRSRDALVSRCGGEEFCVLASAMTMLEGEKFAERLRCSLSRSKVSNGKGGFLSVTASFGVAVIKPSRSDAPAAEIPKFIENSDKAMYVAKKKGRNQVFVAPKHEEHWPAIANTHEVKSLPSIAS
jgi:diguanylate cyclase (GGDEF)-like protein